MEREGRGTSVGVAVGGASVAVAVGGTGVGVLALGVKSSGVVHEAVMITTNA